MEESKEQGKKVNEAHPDDRKDAYQQPKAGVNSPQTEAKAPQPTTQASESQLDQSAQANAKLRSEKDELIQVCKRVQAEYENYRKRVERDQQDSIKFAGKKVIMQLLPILDNFELALKTMNKDDSAIKGFELIYSQFYDILRQAGLERMECVNHMFNPNLHEALLQDASDKPANIVIEELQAGYTLHDQVIRHAKVKISKGQANR